jgi:hypothetical protein
MASRGALVLLMLANAIGCGERGFEVDDGGLLRGLARYDMGGGLIYVASTADAANADGTAAHPFTSVKDAVDAVDAARKTILIAPGSYDEPEQIVIGVAGTRLIGYRSFPTYDGEGFLTGFGAPTVIRLSFPTNVFGNGMIDIRADDVEIAGLEIRVVGADNHAIRAGRPADAGIYGIRIHDNQIETRLTAISFFKVSGKIERNRSVEPGSFGAYISGGRADLGGAQVKLADNDFRNKYSPTQLAPVAQASGICFQFAMTDQESLFTPPAPTAPVVPAILAEGRIDAQVSHNRLIGGRAGVVIVFRSALNRSDATKWSYFEGLFQDNEITGNTWGVWISAGATFVPTNVPGVDDLDHRRVGGHPEPQEQQRPRQRACRRALRLQQLLLPAVRPQPLHLEVHHRGSRRGL